jgi:hypothetical protein
VVRAQKSAVTRLAAQTPATFELVIDLKAAKALTATIRRQSLAAPTSWAPEATILAADGGRQE